MAGTLATGAGYNEWLARRAAEQPMWWSLDFWLKNHFVPWGRIGSFALLVVHLYLVWWVYRDAERRFHNGVWFALFAAIFPLGGWLFYLVYRSSSLPEYDLIELKERIFERYPAVEYDIYLAYQRQEALLELMRKVKEFFLPTDEPAGPAGYNDEVNLSRQRELLAQRSAVARENLTRTRERLQQRMKAIGASMQHALSPRRRRLQEKMELLRLLTEVPVPDDQLEELIYQGNLPVARLYCEDQLMLAKEQNDERRIISYERYLHRVQELERRESERDDTH